MKSSIGLVKYALYIVLSLGLLIGLVNCHTNSKLDIADGDSDLDADGDFDLVEADTEVIEQEAEIVVPDIELGKWFTAHNAIVAARNDTPLVYIVSEAGLIGLDINETNENPNDDKYLLHHDLTLENWPTEKIIGSCIDAAENDAGESNKNVWIATKNDLFLFNSMGTFDDKSDDLFVAADFGESSPEILSVHCPPEEAGVWVATTAGFIAIDPTYNSEDASNWTMLNYAEESNPVLKSRIYAADIDTDGNLFVVTFFTDTDTNTGAYHLHMIDTSTLTDSSDDTTEELVYDLAGDFGPSSIKADGHLGLWIMNNKRAVYLSHQGTLSAGDDKWISMLTGADVDLADFFPISDGLSLAIDSSLSTLYLFDTNKTDDSADDTIKEMADIGLDFQNTLVSAIYQRDAGLFYSAEADFGLLVFGDNLADDSYTRIRYSGVGGVPGNDISGFVKTSDAVYLGGANGVTKVEYQADSLREDFVFKSNTLNDADKLTPFRVKTMDKLEDGVIAGGAYLAYITSSGKTSIWDGYSALKSVNQLAVGTDDNIWVSTMLKGIITIPAFNVYNYNNTPKNDSDDETKKLSSDYYGTGAGAGANAIVFFDGCKALLGNDLGLHYYDCNGTPLDETDDIAENLSPIMVRSIVHAGDTGFWMVGRDGLFYYDIGSDPATTDDDQTLTYTIPSVSYSISYNQETGLLYYFASDGLVIHDTNKTPLDSSDDKVATLQMPTSKQAIVKLDSFNNVWFSYGTGEGIYYGKIGNPDFVAFE